MTPAVLSKEVARPAVLFGILVRRQQIECSDDLAAHRRNRVVRYDEDKVVAANVPDKSIFSAGPLHHVMQQLGQNPDDAVALVVAIPVVEFLEVIQVCIADGEIVSQCQTSADL